LHLLAGAGVAALNRIIERAEELGATVLLCGITEETSQSLESPELTATLRPDQTFLADNALFASTRQAHGRAQQIVGQSREHGQE
jgi:hypothetical protein